MNQFDTLLLYWGLIAVSFFFGCMSQIRCVNKCTGTYRIHFNLFWFALAYIFVLFFTTATEVGADFIPYSRGYGLVTWDTIAQSSSEPGFVFVELLLKGIIRNPNTGIQVIKALTVSVVFYVFYRHRFEIHIGLAILAYMSLAFCDSLNLLSLHLASSFVLLGISYLVKKQILPALLITVCAGFIHYSTFLALASVLITIFLIKRERLSKWKTTVLGIVLILIVPNIVNVTQGIIEQFTILQKYNVYEFRENNASGLAIIFYLAPVVYYAIQHLLKSRKDRWGIIAISGAATSYVIANASYYFIMLSRAQTVVWFLYFLFLPYVANQARLEKTVRKSSNVICGILNSHQIVMLLLVCYFIVRFILYISSGSLGPAGVDRYIFR